MRRPRSYPPAHRPALSTGLLLRRRALGSDSVCRVRSATGPIVEVEVVEAPGMKPGARIDLCIAAARALERMRSISALPGRESGATVRTIARPAA
jgi:hypothetical protein